jgi:hypothetical protein
MAGIGILRVDGPRAGWCAAARAHVDTLAFLSIVINVDENQLS